MKEHFIITLNRTSHFKHLGTFFISLIIAFIIVFPIIGIQSVPSILSFLLLFIIIYIILMSMSKENLSNELPSTLYPSLPHTGLDGISLNNYIAGTSVSNPNRF